MRIVVYGAGGVGGYFGGRLAQAGQEVIFIARGPHLKAIQTNGLRVDSIKGDFTVHPIQATDAPATVGPADAVLVCVKAWQVPEIAPNIRPMIGPETLIVPLENGVDAPSQLAEALGPEHVLGGICRISSMVLEPGHIAHVGIEPTIVFGELDGQPSRRSERLLQALQNAGIQASISNEIQTVMWMKFLFIAPVSGVGAVTRVPVGVFRSLPETRQMLIASLEEVWSVGRAHGIPLPAEAVEKTLATIDSLPPDTIASMHRDILNGRPSELESQNGAVVRLAQAKGLSVPINTYIYHSLLPQEKTARGII